MIRLHRRVTVLKLATPTLSQELQAMNVLKDHTEVSLNETTYLLRKEESQPLVKKLVRLGYKPRVEKS